MIVISLSECMVKAQDFGASLICNDIALVKGSISIFNIPFLKSYNLHERIFTKRWPRLQMSGCKSSRLIYSILLIMLILLLNATLKIKIDQHRSFFGMNP